MSWRVTYPSSVVLLLLSLVACSAGGSEPANTSAPTAPPPSLVAAATLAPTAVPTEVPPTAVPLTAVPATEVPPTEMPPTDVPAAPTPAPLSFTPATYTDTSAGFALDYPADWTVDPNSQIGMRGGEALLLSPGATRETFTEGSTRVSITTYLWDPKRDLEAYVAQRKVAWEASGFPILSEDSWQLAGGREARIFMLDTPERRTFWMVTTVGDDYLQISGEGDLALAEEIARTLRPLE